MVRLKLFKLLTNKSIAFNASELYRGNILNLLVQYGKKDYDYYKNLLIYMSDMICDNNDIEDQIDKIDNLIDIELNYHSGICKLLPNYKMYIEEFDNGYEKKSD